MGDQDTGFWDDLAVRSYKYLLKNNPNSPLIHHNLGLVYQRLKNEDLAIRHFKKALKADVNHLDAYYHLGKLLIRTKRGKKARKYLEHYEKLSKHRYLEKKRGPPNPVSLLLRKLDSSSTDSFYEDE
jgi:tetratricopeptide (TPR) repeat protein